jgi:hypothetical protein
MAHTMACSLPPDPTIRIFILRRMLPFTSDQCQDVRFATGRFTLRFTLTQFRHGYNLPADY